MNTRAITDSQSAQNPRQNRGRQGDSPGNSPHQQPCLRADHLCGWRHGDGQRVFQRQGHARELPNGGNVAAAAAVGKRLAEKAKGLGIEKVAFDRAGFKFHGRVKALAEAAREGGLVF
jgi:ribosome modulation factor